MILKTFTVTVEMKEEDPQEPNGLTEHIKDMLRTAEIRSQRGKMDFRIKKISVRRKRNGH